MKITASIVLYHNDPEEVMEAVQSCLSSPLIDRLYLIDNSIDNNLQQLVSNERITYQHTGRNIGFGTAHNIALQQVISLSDYHIVINPDIAFEAVAVEKLFHFMETNTSAGLVMPKVYYKNGELQRLCKLLPTPFNLFGRRFASSNRWAKRLNETYELNHFNYSQVMDIPNLSGCFMFIRTKVIAEVGAFDERYFLYLEDVDLVRRIGTVARTVFYPLAEVRHGYQKSSYHNSALMRIHIHSALKYFNKWGWFFDAERKRRNQETLRALVQEK